MAEDKKQEKKEEAVDLTKSTSSISRSSSKIKLVQKHPVNGKYVVMKESGGFYLVPTEKMDFSFLWQSVSDNVLSEKAPDEITKTLTALGIGKKGSK
jgi:hypothetical protein